MLRDVFVLLILVVGGYFCFQGPDYVLLLYIWNAYFRPEHWVWSAQWLLTLKVSYVLGVAIVVSTIFSKQRFRFTFHSFLLFLILAQALVSVLLCEHFDYAWSSWVDFLKATLIAFLIPALANDRKKLRLLILVMCLSLGFEGSKQGWVGMLSYPGALNSNDIPFLGDNNGVAVGMLMLTPLFGALVATTSSKWAKRFLGFLMIGVVYRALSTYSRGGFLSCAALAVIYWIRSRGKLRLLLAFSLTAAIVLPVLPDEFWGRMQTIKTYEEVEDDSALSRLHFWQVALKMADANPFFGVGFNAYNLSFDKYDFFYGRYGEGRSVHSVWFGVVAELGYGGLFLYVFSVILALRNCAFTRKVARRNPQYSDLERFATSVESGLWVFLVGGTFLSFQYNEMFFHFIGLSIALRIAARSIDGTAGDTPQSTFENEAGASKSRPEFEGART